VLLSHYHWSLSSWRHLWIACLIKVSMQFVKHSSLYYCDVIYGQIIKIGAGNCSSAGQHRALCCPILSQMHSLLFTFCDVILGQNLVYNYRLFSFYFVLLTNFLHFRCHVCHIEHVFYKYLWRHIWICFTFLKMESFFRMKKCFLFVCQPFFLLWKLNLWHKCFSPHKNILRTYRKDRLSVSLEQDFPSLID
jgi:hypothetical protein